MPVKKLLLLDSSALINAPNFSFNPKNHYLITSEIDAELKSFENRLLVDNAFKQGVLELQNPKPESLEKLSGFLKEIGDKRLSKADKSLLALALELKQKKQKFVAVSDDYSLQNACKHLKIPFQEVLQGKIKNTKKWV